MTKNFQIDAKQVPPLIQKAVMHGKKGIRGHVVAAGWGQCKVSIYNSSFRPRGTSLAQFFIKHHVIPAACALKKSPGS